MSDRQVDEFNKKIKELQDEAKETETILRELAGLEKYISETYISRVFYEIIQNADDCKSKNFHAFLSGNNLYLLNDGNEFTVDDLESLCRSAFSKKSRGDSIGYRGIGFKSVAGICSAVSLMSGNLEVSFSKKKTESLFGYPISVPLLRVPHEGALNIDCRNEAKTLMMKGHFNTCFVLHEINLEKIYTDMVGIRKESIIFLRNIQNISINLVEQSTEISLSNEINYGDISNKIYSSDKLIKEEFLYTSGRHIQKKYIRIWNYKNIQISTDLVESKPIRLTRNNAYAHAFLPMRTVTGLGARVNGDFSTDPSRTRIDPDERTKESLADVADLIVFLLKKLMDESINDNEFSLLEVLIPYNKFQFFSIEPAYISDQIKERIFASKINMNSFCLKPRWMQEEDYEVLTAHLNKRSIVFENVSDHDYESFFKKLGAYVLDLEATFNLLNLKSISQQGLFALIEFLFSEVDKFKELRKLPSDILNNAKIFITDEGKILSSKEINSDDKLDISFISKIFNLTGRSMDAIEFCRICDLSPHLLPVNLIKPFVKRLVLSSDPYHQALLTCFRLDNELNSFTVKSETKNNLFNSTLDVKKNDLFTAKKNPPKWREVEKFAALIMEELDYEVKDVSRKNLGYDLEAINSQGETVFIEVKKISQTGEDFLITDNELFSARQKGMAYYLLLIVQSGEGLPSHYSLINFPYPMLEDKVERRAVKHENFCSGYKTNFKRLNFLSW